MTNNAFRHYEENKCDSCINRHSESKCKGCKYSIWDYLKGDDDKYKLDCKHNYPYYNVFKLICREIIGDKIYLCYRCTECGKIRKQLKVTPIIIENEFEGASKYSPSDTFGT